MPRRYVLKLRQELEEFTADIFAGAAEREQIRSVLADLAKTSGDFRQLAGWALASLAAALLNRLRCWPHPVASTGLPHAQTRQHIWDGPVCSRAAEVVCTVLQTIKLQAYELLAQSS